MKAADLRGTWPPLEQGRKSRSVRSKRSRKPTHAGVQIGLLEDAMELHEDIQQIGHDAADWTLIETLIDSGAARSVCPTTFCAHVPIRESPASKRGQLFRTAGGELIRNRGDRLIKGVTAEHIPVGMRYAVTDVHVPLDSVSQNM